MEATGRWELAACESDLKRLSNLSKSGDPTVRRVVASKVSTVGLSDVTVDGVERAMAEFDRLGRDVFLARFGFGRARGYFLTRQGRRYDSKALVGAAHGYDRPDLGPLLSQDFSGGEATVARVLESLGFDVEKPSRNPAWAEEELILALDLYVRSGVLSATHPDVIEASRALRALPIHGERPDPARFRNANSVNLKLANFAAIDPNHEGRGMARGGKLDAEVWDRYASDEDKLAEAAAAIREGHELPRVRPAEHVRPAMVETEVEAQHVERFHVTVGAQVAEAERREQTLVLAYREHLVSRGHEVVRHLYHLTGSGSPLACDLVDKTADVLYEAKGDLRRTSVRMAIGQLLDYRRFEPATISLGVLLPRKPPQDFIDLIRSVPASVIWRTDRGFASDPPEAVSIDEIDCEGVSRGT